ncbi:MAG: hypothetical protein WDO74_25890 [Pseudomonadota bacterium]
MVGIETTSAHLLDGVRALEPGELLRIVGASGSGRTALLRRVAWSLGVLGSSLAWIEDVTSASSLDAELGAHASLRSVFVLVDDADALSDSSLAALANARAQGARLVTVGGASWSGPVLDFAVPALDEQAAIDLLRGAVPSLTQSLLKRVFEVSAGRPGELRRLVRIIASDAVASADDLERVLGSVDTRTAPPPDPLTRARFFLERGRYNDVKTALAMLTDDDRVETAIARARLRFGLGDAPGAAQLLRDLSQRGDATARERCSIALYLARTEIGLNGCQRALSLLEPLLSEPPPLCTEALSYRGLALSMLGKQDEAREALELALSQATESGAARLEAIALTSLGFVAQRCESQ